MVLRAAGCERCRWVARFRKSEPATPCPAGKSTTFKMLTGEVQPDRGDAVLGGSSITHATSAARQLLGYCPQFEAVPGAMTGREVLAMYGRWVGRTQ